MQIDRELEEPEQSAPHGKRPSCSRSKIEKARIRYPHPVVTP
jgi:hypothetical protein